MWRMSFEKSKRPILDTVDKLGGSPVGLDDVDWPSCKTCNTPLAFVMQLTMGPNSAVPAEVEQLLYLFICNNHEMQGECKTADPDMGDNAVLILPFDELLEGGADIPEDSNGMAAEYFVRLAREEWPGKCEECGQPINSEEIACPKCSRFQAFYSRIGGPPSWIHDPEIPLDNDGKPMEFIGQINWDVGDRGLNIANFGTGYLFVSRDRKRGKFLHQT